MIPATRWTSGSCANSSAIRPRNGQSRACHRRGAYRHGLAAAVLLYDPRRGVVTLVRQFRAGAYLSDGALATIEACAGMLDGDAPEACAVREALEETGIAIRDPVHAFDAYMIALLYYADAKGLMR